MRNDKVLVLTNDIWSKFSEDDYEELKQNEESRHLHYDSQIWQLDFGLTGDEETSKESILDRPLIK